MLDHKELIETARRAKGSDLLPKVIFGAMNAETLILRLADALEAAQVKMKEAVAEATAAAYGAASQGVSDLRESEEIFNATPQSARDWLADHDRETVERERERWASWIEAQRNDNPATGQEFAAAIRAGGNA